MSLARHWIFVLNNYTAEDLALGAALIPGHTYLGYAEEVGESGTPHLQGYVCMESKKRLSSMRKLLPRAHFEQKKGTVQQARDYYAANPEKGSPVGLKEYGTLPAEQHAAGRAGLEAEYSTALAAAKAGDWDAIPAGLYIRYHRSLRDIHTRHAVTPSPLAVLDNTWIVGEPGTGKTTMARGMAPEAYLKGISKWWCGYERHEDVIIEDVGMSARDHADLFKQWADHWPFQCEVKGGSMVVRPKRIIVTSNYTIDEIFYTKDAEAISRRFKIVRV